MSVSQEAGGSQVSSRADNGAVGEGELGYDVPMDCKDIDDVESRSAAEKLLQTAAKARGVRGVVAAPLAMVKEGAPQHLTWVVTSVKEGKDGVGAVPEDNRLKWNIGGNTLFKEADETVCIRMDCDLRNVSWRTGKWCSQWMSCEDLGITVGTRSKRASSSGLGRFEEMSEEEVNTFGCKDFPVRMEVAPGETTTDCLITIMAIPRNFADRKTLPGKGGMMMLRG